MAHIVDFRISGLAGRVDDFECKLNRDINVFFGLNGCGKTSLLKILYSAMSGDTKILENVPFVSAEVRIHSLQYDKDFVYTINKLNVTSKIQNQRGSDHLIKDSIFYKNVIPDKKLTWSTQGEGDLLINQWQHRYLPTNRLLFDSSREQPVEFFNSSEDVDQLFADNIKNLWLTYSAEILGEVREVQEKGLTNILRDVFSQTPENNQEFDVDLKIAYDKASQFLSRQNADQLLGPFDQFVERYRNEKSIKKVINDIVSTETAIETAVQPLEKLKGLVQRLYTGNKIVEFIYSEISVKDLKNEEIGLYSLSSGEKQLLRIFIEVLVAQLSSLIIDEPELSMHIDWQKELINDLTLLNPESQLIIATHSPEIMATLSEDKIFRL